MFLRKTSLIFYLTRRSFYDTKTRNDTIFATATTINNIKGSPLGVIRVSGPKTGHILEKITNFDEVEKKLKPRHATLAKIFEPNTKELIDLGLVILFPSPNSYTGEDVCELHLHGSQAIITKMLTILGSKFTGVRPAEPGEFTRRAVVNGKLSLMQAESLPDLIKSSTDNQRRLALNGLDGSTREKYNQWTVQLVNILAHLEASIDFGEDELIGEQAVISDCVEKLKQLANIVDSYIEASARCREFINDGANIAILGKPNAGKSTFMNLLCRRDLSIVSDLSGTTRDLVRHSLELGGHSITLCDTAGLRDIASENSSNQTLTESDNLTSESYSDILIDRHKSIEQEGIKRALDAARKADILIYLIDGSQINCCRYRDDNKQINQIDGIYNEMRSALDIICNQYSTNNENNHGSNNNKLKLVHIVMNKLDLNDDLKSENNMIQPLKEIMKTKFERKHSIDVDISMISCKTQENFSQFVHSLTDRLDKICSPPHLGIDNKFDSNAYNGPVQFDYVNQRHLSLLKSMHGHLKLASQMDLTTVDKMAQHVRESVDYLSRVVGTISSDDVIDVIFRDFCIGK